MEKEGATYDAVIVGAGPAGSLAARTAAQGGLRTLVLERSALPRSKACNGLLWPETIQFLENEVGKISTELLLTEPLEGICIHNNSGQEIVQKKLLNVWRRDFDHWLTVKAMEEGAEVWKNTLVSSFEDRGKKLRILVKKEGQIQTLETTFLIAADGSGSRVRRLLYPQIVNRAARRSPYIAYLNGSANLDWRFFHIWVNPLLAAFYASVSSKGKLIMVSSNAVSGENLRERYTRFEKFLAEEHGLRGNFRFAEGCVIYGLPTEEVPLLGRDNIVLVGDAAGLRREYGEGIFCSMGSGRAAGISAVEAKSTNANLAEVYRGHVRGVVEEAMSSLDQWKQKEQMLKAQSL